MKLQILDEAAAEFADAIARYESIESGLGVRLKEEVKSVVAWIADQPELPRVRSTGYRRVNLKVFWIKFRIEESGFECYLHTK